MKLDDNYWVLIKKAHKVKFDLNLIHKLDKKKEQDKKKVLNAIYIAIHNKEILDGGLVLYKKTPLVRLVLNQLLKYYIHAFDKNSHESLLEL
jgi:hypothetical protein|tara:strand:- start:1445 stop:1720 length:276 start_codon:yes stop_codon:yes gene_type:complete